MTLDRAKLPYRLALDLGTNSLGWAILRLKKDEERYKPTAIIKAGVRIFSDGRNPKDGTSNAVKRREARQARRRRDRLLKRKSQMLIRLIQFGFFPKTLDERKALEHLNPYKLRAKGLNEQLTAYEFGRALFHMNQRRGFKSNRKTDSKENDSSVMKDTIKQVSAQIDQTNTRTIGELLYQRQQNQLTVRARYREQRIVTEGNKTKINKSYDLYINRQMIEDEFEVLWAKQNSFNPTLFNEDAKLTLKDTLLFQRKLRAVRPGRCSLLPNEQRAELAYPSAQRLRIFQETNHLRILNQQLKPEPLTLEQRNLITGSLEKNGKLTFTAIKKKLGLSSQTKFNLEDDKRTELIGNKTSSLLSEKEYFDKAWFEFNASLQDEIVKNLLNEENEKELIQWLCQHTQINQETAKRIAQAPLITGHSAFCLIAIKKLLDCLKENVITYDKAVKAAGYEDHSKLNYSNSGEILESLPYYGAYLQRHVGFGTGAVSDSPEKRYGKIANPTVHIGLNQVRRVVNAIIKKYGHPTEIVVELARDLKRSKKERDKISKMQKQNEIRNNRIRTSIAQTLNISENQVSRKDLEKWILWEELSADQADRKCPYTGVQISASKLLSPEVEIEHILPFSKTLDDSLNNKTVSLKRANAAKGNQTPWEAFGQANSLGIHYDEVIERAKNMPKDKFFRFAENGMEQWLHEHKDFLARALNDTRYLSRIAKEYLHLICPDENRIHVIPGQMTEKLRAKFGLNQILSDNGGKNRNDHRHHAIDACVIGVTDRGLLQRFANANQHAKEKGLEKLVEEMPMPWPTYRNHVERAVKSIIVSHKPEHNFEGEMFDATIYNTNGYSKKAAKIRKVIPFPIQQEIKTQKPYYELIRPSTQRHKNKPYKGLLTTSNYCIEIFKNDAEWGSDVLSTFEAYQVVSKYKSKDEGFKQLRNKKNAQNGKPLIMRLSIGDYVVVELERKKCLLQVLKIDSKGSITFIKPNEANISARYNEKLKAEKNKKEQQNYDEKALNDDFFQKAMNCSSLLKGKARQAKISELGILNDPGFKN